MSKKIFFLIFFSMIISPHAKARDYVDFINNDTSSSVFSLEEKKVTNITECNQNFNNSHIGGNVVMNCISIIEKKSHNENIKIKKLSSKLARISKNIEKLEGTRNLNNEEVQKNIKSNKIDILRIHKKYLEHKNEIESVSSYINRLKTLKISDANLINMKINIEENNKESAELINDLELVIHKNEILINELDLRVDLVESNLGFLMDEYNNGNLQSISFYGPKIGIKKVSGVTYNIIGFEYERLLDPKYNLSFYIEASKYSGEKETISSTLNGLGSQTVKEDSSFYAVGLGMRKFLRKINDYNFYLGGDIGHSTGDEKIPIFNLYMGIEMYKKYNKLSLELGTFHFNGVKNKQVNFNPLGQSENIEIEENESGVSLSLRYSTR